MGCLRWCGFFCCWRKIERKPLLIDDPYDMHVYYYPTTYKKHNRNNKIVML